MKIQLPIINIESDDIEYAINALMLEHKMPRDGAKAYLIKSIEYEAKISVRNLVANLKASIDFKNGQRHLCDVNKL